MTFAPHTEAPQTDQTRWDFVGKRAQLVPTEKGREVPAVDNHGSKLQDLRVTEDNIVLLYVSDLRVGLCGCVGKLK